MIEIPLNSSPEQLFSITLGGNTYDLRVKLNSRLAQWAVSFAQNGTDIITGIPLVGGIDILNQYNIAIENMYIVNLDNPNLDPNVDNLGTVSKLFILTEEEITSVSSI